MPPSSPVTTKKARGLAAQKTKEPPPIDTDEYDAEFREIEKDLEEHRLGNVKIYFKNMTFEWKDGHNREIADENRSASLRDNMRNGIFRADPVHRMSGILRQSEFKSALRDPKNAKSIAPKDVVEFNKKAEFPILVGIENFKIEMQSGQHRMKILRQLRPDEKDHWWIVTVYDDSSIFFEDNNLMN
jgi:hypothetical protein